MWGLAFCIGAIPPHAVYKGRGLLPRAWGGGAEGAVLGRISREPSLRYRLAPSSVVVIVRPRRRLCQKPVVNHNNIQTDKFKLKKHHNDKSISKATR